jgi:outer membrane protein assembly factor BamB
VTNTSPPSAQTSCRDLELGPAFSSARRFPVPHRSARHARLAPSRRESRPLKTYPVFGTILAAAAVVTLTLALPGKANADWTQYRGNEARSARAPWLGPGPSIGTAAPVGRRLWRRFIGRPDANGEPAIFASAPVIGPDGTVYIGAARKAPDHLYAYAPDGTLRWSTDLRGYAVYGTPALRRNGRMMVIGDRFDRDRQRAFIVNSRDGSIEATTDVSNEMGGSPLVNRRGDFFYRNGDAVWRILHSDHRSRPSSQLAARHVYPVTGGPGLEDFLSGVWEFLQKCFPGCEFDSTGAVAPPYPIGRYLPAPAISRCEDLTSPLREYLQRTWSGFGRETKTAAVTTPAMGQGGRAYVGLEGQRLGAYDARGRENWKLKMASQPVAVAIGHIASPSPVTSQCYSISSSGRSQTWVEQDRFRDRLFVLGGDGRLVALDPSRSSATTVWSTGARDLVGEPVVVATAAGDQVLVSSMRRLHAFRAEDGAELWSVRLDSRVLGSPAVAGGRIYVATRTSLWAIR